MRQYGIPFVTIDCSYLCRMLSLEFIDNGFLHIARLAGFVQVGEGRARGHRPYRICTIYLEPLYLQGDRSSPSGKRSLKVKACPIQAIETGVNPKACNLKLWSESQQGWHPTQTPNGPLKYVDKNGIIRVTLKQGSPRAPGSNHPHVELRNAKGIRIDLRGNPFSRRSL